MKPWWAALERLDPSKPWLLDLYCGAMGAGEGYRQAGFAVLGVDELRRAHLPPGAVFVEADALEVLADLDFVRRFVAVHTSPPCKVHTRLAGLQAAQGGTPSHGDLIPETRAGLEAAGVPWVMENVSGSPLTRHVTLCGSTFPELTVTDSDGFKWWLQRHRLFELGGWGLMGWGLEEPCRHKQAGMRPLGIYGRELGDAVPGGGQVARTLEEARAIMGMPWASWAGITQAIPPAYTRHLGRALLEEVAP